ncbi:hypothetical protein AVEN_189557-1 [Araneus ventricosus]|uniref:Uncharacterized protein n=1 Tax=Araneus ventricosus TaxID=182803 RepID=A0A4Y2UMY2_ARAVE|nr:hypothetical protein AVEN_189557-1 [Araneus ventricosus]
MSTRPTCVGKVISREMSEKRIGGVKCIDSSWIIQTYLQIGYDIGQVISDTSAQLSPFRSEVICAVYNAVFQVANDFSEILSLKDLSNKQFGRVHRPKILKIPSFEKNV